MNRVIGFTIYEKNTGKELATLPLTIPIGQTVEAYKKEGHNVVWTWKEVADEAN